MRTPLARIALAVILAALPVAGALAQAYPAKAIRVVVPFAPGGTSDIIGRTLGQRLSEAWKQPVVMDNRAGVAGSLGASIAAKSPPDGYTLLVGNVGPIAVNPQIYKAVEYDSIRDFTPITLAVTAPQIVVVHPSVPAKTFKEFMALVKRQKGSITFGSSGPGSVSHLSGELFKLRAGLNLTHVPYKSAGASVADVVGGQIQSTMTSPPPALSLAKAGRLRILAQATAKRTSLLSDIPTFEESGVSGVQVTNWYSIMSVGGTPKPVLKRLHDELMRAISSPDMRQRLAAGALEPAPTTPEEFRKKIAGELQRWARVVKDAGIKQE